MSYTAAETLLDPANRRCEASELSVLLALALHVNQKDAERGWPWLAWPSQALLAAEVGLSDRQLRRKLGVLKSVCDIRENGEIKGRGIRVYELIKPEHRSDLTRVDISDREGSDPTTLDDSDTGQIRPPDRSDPTTTPDIFGRDPGHPCPTEPGEPEKNQEEKAEVSRADAREDSPPDSESFLSAYGSGRPRPPAHEMAEALEDARELLRERADAFDAAEVGTPEKQEAHRLKAEQEIVVARLEGGHSQEIAA
jgi:hypothetical protein